MKKAIMAPAVATAVLLVLGGPAAAAPAEPLNIRVVNITNPGGFHGRAILTGAVTGACQDGPPVVTFGPAGTFHIEDTIVCAKGTLFVSAEGTGMFELDPRTCIARVPQSGTFEITGGTGEFAGATGGGVFTGEGRAVFGRTRDGCALDQPPLVDVLRVNLSGTVAI